MENVTLRQGDPKGKLCFKWTVALLAVLILALLGGALPVYATTAAGSAGFTVEPLKNNADGKVAVTFDAATAKPMLLLAFDRDGNLLTADPVKVSSGETAVTDLKLFDPAAVHGGQSVVSYMGLFKAADLPNLDIKTATITPGEQDLTVAWDAGASGASDTAADLRRVTCQKISVIRAVERINLSAYKQLSGGGKSYTVGPNQALTFELTTNEPGLSIKAATIAGQTVTPENFKETPGSGTTDTVYKFTVTLPADAPNGKLAFALTTSAGDVIDQDADYYTTKVSFQMPDNSGELELKAQSNFVMAGDEIRLYFTGAPIETINSLDLGDSKDIPASDLTIKKDEAYIQLQLSHSNMENYENGAMVTAALHATDTAGNDITLALPASRSLPYMHKPTTGPTKATLEVANHTAYLNGTAFHLQDGDRLAFTLVLPCSDDNRKMKTVNLEVDGVACQMTFVGYGDDATATYTLTLDVGDHAANQSWTDDESFKLAVSGEVRNSWDPESARKAVPIDFDSTCGLEKTMYYFKGLEITGLLVNKVTPTVSSLPKGYTDPLPEVVVVDGDKVEMTLKVSHPLVDDENLVLQVGGMRATRLSDHPKDAPYRGAYYELGKDKKTIKVTLYITSAKDAFFEEGGARLDVQLAGADQSNLFITLASHREKGRPSACDTKAWPEQKETIDRKACNILVYWAPLRLSPGIDIAGKGSGAYQYDDLDEGQRYLIVRDKETLELHFTANQTVVWQSEGRNSPIRTTLSGAGGSNELNCDYKLENGVYSTSFTVGNGPLANLEDQTVLRFGATVTDARGQTATINPADVTCPIYYAQLQITDITFTSSNMNDETRYCKDEDTLTVQFTANHYVALESSIAGKPGEYGGRRQRHSQPATYQFSCTLENGDVNDLAEVAFSFTATDLAGQSAAYTDASVEVSGRLKYYAPVVASGNIKSSNSNASYVRNGDTVTVSTSSNHEVQVHDFSLNGRKIGVGDSFLKNPALTYQIPGDESQLPEGEIFFALRLEDPAGNYELISSSDKEYRGGKVIYDRTRPTITILPSFNGFTNEDVSFTFLYSDMYLNLPFLSCTLNEHEQLRGKSGTDHTFSYEVTLTEEGEYRVSAAAVDMAGNETELAAVCHLIIDKTKPRIHMELERNTFQLGFTLDSITSIKEDYLDDFICTITDSEGVHDWALDLPIDTEGKKTVFTVAKDMAGNSSVPITYDIFIDGTPPEPQVINADSQEAFLTGGRSLFVGLSGSLDISLAELHIGDEDPDQFTTLRLVDADGNLLVDFLAEEPGAQAFSYKLSEFGTYSLLAEAVDGVGNETGPLLYLIEFREQYLLEKMVEGTPLANLQIVKHIGNTLLFVLCGAAVALIAGIAVLLVVRHRRKK